LFLALGTGCKPKVLSGKALQDKLIETMSDYLKNNPKNNITFTVQDVTYYPDINKKLYDCQFHVKMSQGDKDTIGVMTATITNDFKEVVRKQ
jgi:hypothetical protein